jgi:hypothetical protein
MLENFDALSRPANTPDMSAMKAARSIGNAPDDPTARPSEQASESDIAKRSPHETAREYWIATTIIMLALAGLLYVLESVVMSMLR